MPLLVLSTKYYSTTVLRITIKIDTQHNNTPNDNKNVTLCIITISTFTLSTIFGNATLSIMALRLTIKKRHSA